MWKNAPPVFPVYKLLTTLTHTEYRQHFILHSFDSIIKSGYFEQD